jgi:ribosome-binding protein aMBF1 (putative translation factor)
LYDEGVRLTSVSQKRLKNVSTHQDGSSNAYVAPRWDRAASAASSSSRGPAEVSWQEADASSRGPAEVSLQKAAVPTSMFDSWELSGALWADPVESHPVTSPANASRSRSRSKPRSNPRSPSISERTQSPSTAVEDPYECVKNADEKKGELKNEEVEKQRDDEGTIASVKHNRLSEDDKTVSRVLTAACLLTVKKELLTAFEKKVTTDWKWIKIHRNNVIVIEIIFHIIIDFF